MKNLLKVHSADGMELRLEVAELGSRSYAFIIDWHFRLLLSLAWLFGAWMLMTGAGDQTIRSATFESGNHWGSYVFFLPATLIYVFYHPVLEIVMRGRTPGKRMAGIRLVTGDGQTPGVAAIIIRNLFRLVDSLPAFYAAGCVACIATRRQVRIGDMAAGTLLVYEEKVGDDALDRARNLVSNTDLVPADQALLLDIVDRWKTLDRKARTEIATRFLAKIGRAAPVVDGTDELDRVLHDQLRDIAGVSA
ncbi:MAG TPA: RDD family protein [Gammaproteobacteria bacterium]|nr:RDD family protein [Gammaproteobacteria bacterium]